MIDLRNLRGPWLYIEALDDTPEGRVHKLSRAECYAQGQKDRAIGYRDEHLRRNLSGPKRKAYDRGNA